MQLKIRQIAALAMIAIGCVAVAADNQQSAGEDLAEAVKPGPRTLREFRPEQVQEALAATVARQQAFYETMAAKSRRKGTWTPLGLALGCCGVSNPDKGNLAILKNYEKAFEATMARARGPWYSFYLEQRLLLLFGSQSQVFPGRMSPAAEKILMDKLWESAQSTVRLEMTLPGRDWWSVGSENHWTHLWTGMWGAAQLFARHPDYKDRGYADGTTTEQMAKAFDEKAKRFVFERASKGLLVEINSPYNKSTLSGLYNVFDFATDPALKERMRMFLDLLWADWAIEQIDAVRGGSRSRSYPGSHSHDGSSLGPVAWYHFGVGEPPLNTHPEMWCAATSSYRPNPLVVELLLDVAGRGTYASISRRPGKHHPIVEDQAIKISSDPTNKLYNAPHHALDPQGGSLLRYTWCNPDFILGASMVEALPGAAWWKASSQNRWDGLLFGGHSRARLYLQPRPAEGRSFYNGNWSVQSKGVLIVQRLRDGMSENAKGQRIWFDEALELVQKDGWVFAQGPRAFAAVRVVEGETDWQADVPFNNGKEAEKAGSGKWLNCQQEQTPVILEAARTSDYASFEAFQQAVKANPLSWNGRRLDYRSNHYRTELTLLANYSQPPQVDGMPLNYTPAKVYDSPFIQGDFGTGVVTLRKGERHVVLDFRMEGTNKGEK